MKIVLDLDEKLIGNMQGYCDTHGIDTNELITTMFNTYVQTPSEVFDDLYEKDGNIKDIEDFLDLLSEYIREATYDIEEGSKSDEAYKTDEAMVHVFKALETDIIRQASNLVRLYEVYKKQ